MRWAGIDEGCRAGFIRHTAFKDHWGRPRPKQVVEFGGHQQFRPYYSPNFFNQPEPSRSFPCGHCTMGYYFFAVAFVLRRMGSKIWEVVSYIFALLLGSALGLARMAQGGHSLSDVLWTALIMWLVAGAFDWLAYSVRERTMKGLTRRQQEIISFVSHFIQTNRYSPSYREIQNHFGFSSLGTVFRHLAVLKRKGALSNEKNCGRSLSIQANLTCPTGNYAVVDWTNRCRIPHRDVYAIPFRRCTQRDGALP